MVTRARPNRGARLLCLAATLLAIGGRVVGDDTSPGGPSEYQIKAAYLYYLSTFVDWPPATFSHKDDALVIGVLGEDPFGDILDDTIRGKAVNSKRLVVKRMDSIKEARGCHILFVSSSEQDNLSYILKALDGVAVLTVGDVDEFASRGGQIGFRTEGKKVRFDINVAAAERAGLKISAQLMKLGRIVEGSERQGG